MIAWASCVLRNFKLGVVAPLGCLETVALRPQLGTVPREQLMVRMLAMKVMNFHEQVF